MPEYIDQIVSIRTHSSLIACFELRTLAFRAESSLSCSTCKLGGSFLVPRHEIREKKSGMEWNERTRRRGKLDVRCMCKLTVDFTSFLLFFLRFANQRHHDAATTAVVATGVVAVVVGTGAAGDAVALLFFVATCSRC